MLLTSECLVIILGHSVFTSQVCPHLRSGWSKRPPGFGGQLDGQGTGPAACDDKKVGLRMTGVYEPSLSGPISDFTCCAEEMVSCLRRRTFGPELDAEASER